MDIDDLILKFIWRDKRPRIVNKILKKNKVGEVALPDFKTFYKATVIGMVWHWWKSKTRRSVEQDGEPRDRPAQMQ